MLRIGSLALPVRRGIAAPAEALFGPLYRGTGRTFDGVIGYDLFAAYVVEIDYAHHVLRLFAPRDYRRATGREAIPIRIVDRKPYLQGVLRFGGQAPIPANLHLDTGYGGALSLNGNFVAEQRLIERAGETLPVRMQGVGGASEARVARMDGLRIGGIAIGRPIVSLSLVHGAGVRSDSAGRIGGELLRRFTVAIDYSGRTLTLAPNDALGEPFETDMSGIALAADPGRPDAFAVSGVTAGTPAALAGLREGDMLVAVDGLPARSLSLEQIRAMLRRDGETRRLRLLRDGAETEVQIRLRRRL